MVDAGDIPPVPEPSVLRDWAMAYLARYAASTHRLAAVLERRLMRNGVDRAAARAAVMPIVAEMAAQRYVDDAAFARQRLAALLRKGVPLRVATGRLRAEGLDPPAREEDASDAATEVHAALAYMRRRRLGAFGPGGNERQLAMMLRAGHPAALVKRLLAAPDREARDFLVDELSADA